MNLTLTLDGVTYGELYEFVDAVRAAGVPADERVRCLGSDEKGDRFEIELGPTVGVPPRAPRREPSWNPDAGHGAVVPRPWPRSPDRSVHGPLVTT